MLVLCSISISIHFVIEFSTSFSVSDCVWCVCASGFFVFAFNHYWIEIWSVYLFEFSSHVFEWFALCANTSKSTSIVSQQKFHWKKVKKKIHKTKAISCLTMENIFLHNQQQFVIKLDFTLRFSKFNFIFHIDFSGVLPLSFRWTLNVKHWKVNGKRCELNVQIKQTSSIEGKMNEPVDKAKSAWDIFDLVQLKICKRILNAWRWEIMKCLNTEATFAYMNKWR